MSTNWSKFVVPVGALILGYYILESWGIIKTPCDPSICTPQCPRGPKYSRGWFGTCDPNYMMCGFLDGDCCCLNAVGKYVPFTEQEINESNMVNR